MAEAAVIPLLSKIISVLGTLGSKIQTLTEPLKTVHNKLDNIRKDLEVMKEFLKYIDAYQGDNRQDVLTWVKQIRDVAAIMEDIIDRYLYLVRGLPSNSRSSFICRVLRDPKIIELYEIANDIEMVEDNLKKIFERKNSCDIRIPEHITYGTEDELSRNLAESAHFIRENEIVGFADKVETLIRWLKNEQCQQKVIYVLGMGGVGKTTLVTRVYKSPSIISHFSCRAWITVSHNSRIDDLLRKILTEFYMEIPEEMTRDIDSMDHKRLVQTLRNFLQHKSYLIILDDVWNPNDWADLKVALRDDNCGSGIIITTRKQDVISTDEYVINVDPLNQGDAWSLFCKKAFARDEGNNCPPELKHCAEIMVNKCDGLPYAIVALANLLQQKERAESVWNNVLNNLSWSESENAGLQRVSTILSLSIKDLPYYLRNCLLYCSVFPEDYRIVRNKLIRLWVAEGFVIEIGQSTMEEVAENYLTQLVGRCLVQVTETNECGRVKNLRVHDLVRDLIITISKEENFFHDYHNIPENLVNPVRRVSVIKDSLSDHEKLKIKMDQLRSFHAFSLIPASLILKFKLLRVLDISYIQIDILPHEITQLFNLHYLSIRHTMIKQLPKSIGNLRNLQTLDALFTYVENIPKGITKLENLRHLLAKRFHRKTSRYTILGSGVNVPGAIWKLKNLQTLKAMIANDTTIKNLEKMTKLRSLDIRGVTTIQSIPLLRSINKMSMLIHLIVMMRYRDDEMLLRALCSPPLQLQKLSLYGKLEKQVQSDFFRPLSKLTHLVLKMSRLTESSITSLLALPKLVSLFLMEAYDGESLSFNEGSLSKLRFLMLYDMAQLNHIEIKMGALENLQELKLVRCNKMNTIPMGIQNLTKLQKLELEDMPEELIRKLKERNLQNIPMIMNWNKSKYTWVEERLF